MEVKIYTVASAAYEQEYDLRNRVLRHPLGMDLGNEDLSRDVQDFHIGLFEGGKLLACLLLHPVDNGTLQMRQVCTEPELQGKGLGRMLVRAAEDFARENKYTKIVLHGRESAAGFYRKLGYACDEVRFFEIGIPHLTFEKELYALKGRKKMNIYFPSCNFTKASPLAAKKIRAYLAGQMPAAGCCRFDKKDYAPGTTAVYFCQACREVLEPKMDTENLFVYLDRDDSFPWPDYSGLTVNIQDCWRDREHPEIFDAVRSVLRKMGVNVIEMEENREKSVFCGNLHFEPKKPENIALMAKYPGMPVYEMPEEVQAALMREQVEKYTCPLVVTYCNRCTTGVKTGGGEAVHLLELAMGTYEK